MREIREFPLESVECVADSTFWESVEAKILLDEIEERLDGKKKDVFRMMREGYSVREIAKATGTALKEAQEMVELVLQEARANAEGASSGEPGV